MFLRSYIFSYLYREGRGSAAEEGDTNDNSKPRTDASVYTFVGLFSFSVRMANFNKVSRANAVLQPTAPATKYGNNGKNIRYHDVENLGEPFNNCRQRGYERNHIAPAPPVLGSEVNYFDNSASPMVSSDPGARHWGARNSYDSQWDNTYKSSGARAAATAVFEQIAAEERTSDGTQDMHGEVATENSTEYQSDGCAVVGHSRKILSSTEEYVCRRYSVSSIPRLEAYDYYETRKFSPERAPHFSATAAHSDVRMRSPKPSVSSGGKSSDSMLQRRGEASTFPRVVARKLDLHATEECQGSSAHKQLSPMNAFEVANKAERQSQVGPTCPPVLTPCPSHNMRRSVADASTMTEGVSREAVTRAVHGNNLTTLPNGHYDNEYFNVGRGGPRSSANESVVSLSTVSNSTLNQRPDSTAFGGYRNAVGQHNHYVSPKLFHNSATQTMASSARPPLTPRFNETRSPPTAPPYAGWDNSPGGSMDRPALNGRPANDAMRVPRVGAAPQEVWAAKLRQLDNAYLTNGNGWAILHEIRLLLEGRNSR